MMITLYGIIFEDRIVTIEKNRFIDEVSKKGNIDKLVLAQNPAILQKHVTLHANQIVQQSQEPCIAIAQYNYEES